METGSNASSSSRPSVTLITDYGVGGSTCGYCGSSDDTHYTHGMQAECMTVESYQALLDRGWRRSGRWVYKPIHSRTCCQLITIRLDVDKFQLTKTQRKAQRRWEAYLAGAPLRHLPAQDVPPPAPTGRDEPQGASPKRMRDESGDLDDLELWGKELQGGGKRQRSSHNLAAMDSGEEEWTRAVSPTAELSEQLQVALGAQFPTAPRSSQDGFPSPISRNNITTPFQQQQATQPPGPSISSADLDTELTQELQAALRRCVDSGQLPDLGYPAPKVSRVTPKQKKKLPPDVGYTSPAALVVAGVAGRAESGKRESASPQAVKTRPLSSEATAQLLLDQMQLPQGVLGAEVVGGHLNFKTAANGVTEEDHATRKEKPPVQSVYKAERSNKSDVSEIALPSIPRSPPRHFEFLMVPSSDAALPTMEFELYKKYQVIHHGDAPDSVTKTSFWRFLCDSPLLPAPVSAYPPGGAPPSGYGSFHQQYMLDGRLIAVGVVDVLPKALSSKYFFWDPDFASLSLGKVASLQEIAWVQEAHAVCPSLRYYYLGYYLHNCHRMRYKAEFEPSDLLCPVKQCWVPIDRVRGALEGGARPPALADVPGAIEGLGEDYLVTSEGLPAAPPRQPTPEEVREVKLFVQMGGNDDGVRRGQVISFGALVQLGLREDLAVRIKRRLEQWIMLVGPGWRSMLYRLE